MELVIDYLVCKCGGVGQEDHVCPFAEDVHGDTQTLCNCCDDCQNECYMDI